MGHRGGRRTVARALMCALALAVTSCAQDDSTDEAAEVEPRIIALLRAVTPPDRSPQGVLLDELAAAGYREGERLTVLGRDQDESHPDPAEAEAVAKSWRARGVDVIVALSSSGALAAAKGAPDVPILFLSNDPVAAGLLENEQKPEGILTGATFRVPADRTLETARRVLPNLDTVGLLYPSNDPAAEDARDNLSHAAAALQLDLRAASFTSDNDVAGAINSLHSQGVQAIVLANAPSTVRAFPAIKAAVEAARIPVIANTATDFALAVLAPDTRELYRQMARQLVRLLQGEKPADIPVEDPARFTFTVNLPVATKLGITVDERVLDTAEVID